MFFTFAFCLEHHRAMPCLTKFKVEIAPIPQNSRSLLSHYSTVLTLLFSIMVYSGATECLPCTSGGRLNETHCSCFAGSHRVNQTSCNVCGPGTYTPRDNMLECVECVGTVTENNTCLCPDHMDLIDDVCVRRNCTPGQKMVSFSLNYWPR